jgi:ABC-type transporter Mla subunit MlaD
MNEEIINQLQAAGERFAAAADALQRTLERLDAHSEKIDRIVATIEEREADADAIARKALAARVAELERANTELKAEAARASVQRKTLPPLVSAILAKTSYGTSGYEPAEKVDAEVLDKTLAALSVEQRIAVKSEMARAGLIE